MRPANGTYRFDYKPGMKMEALLDDEGLHTPWGLLTWRDPPGIFLREGVVNPPPPEQEFAVEWKSASTYEARSHGQTYAGTVTKIA